jgi:phage terminase large subunit
MLSEKDRKALRDGDWDIFDGQYFSEFNRDIHTCKPFEIPSTWRRYRAFDYGLDMLACYWIAVNDQGRAFVYKELYEPNLIVSAAAAAIKERTNDDIYATFAPPDMWNRHKDTGRSTAEIFAAEGIRLTRANNDRAQGWLNVKEWLRPHVDEQGQTCADLCIFDTCVNLIRTLPALVIDEKNPNDTAREPHELTHAPDALRYFIAGRPAPSRPIKPDAVYNFTIEKPKPDPMGRGDKIRRI